MSEGNHWYHFHHSHLSRSLPQNDPLPAPRNETLGETSPPCGCKRWAVLPRETNIEIIEHGWIARETRMVDPSFLLIEHPDQPIFYFPGLSLSWEQLQQCLPGRTLPLVCHTRYGETGMGHHGYQAAYDQAWQHARDLAQQQQLPTTAILVRRRASQTGVTLL